MHWRSWKRAQRLADLFTGTRASEVRVAATQYLTL